MGLDKEYMIPLGGFKIAEFICLLIGWTTMADQFVNTDIALKGERVNFFLAICTISWIFVIILFVCHLKNPCDTSSLKCVVVGIFHFIFGILVLIAASLIADTRCVQTMSLIYTNIHCNTGKYKTGGAFGIISAIILICDALYQVVDFIFVRKSAAKTIKKKKGASDKYAKKDTELGEKSAGDCKADVPAAKTCEESSDEVVYEVPPDATCEKPAEAAQ